MDKLILGILIGVVIGVFFHAAIAAWYDRVKDNAASRLKQEIADLNKKLYGNDH